MSYNPQLCVITATYLHDQIGDDKVAPPGYRLYRHDRGSCGGGVAVITKDNIEVTVADQVCDHESLLLRVSLQSDTFFVCAVYRPPNAADLFLSRLYDHLLKFRDKNLIITGDFYLPFIHWNKQQYGYSVAADALTDLLFTFNLDQIVTAYTCGNAILNLLFISETFSSGTVHVEPGISDHNLIYFCWTRYTKMQKDKVPPATVKDYNRADDTAVIDYLEEHLVVSTNSVESLWQQFYCVVKFCIQHFIPSKRLQKHHTNPWISRQIIQTKGKIKHLRKKHKTFTPQFMQLKHDLQSKVKQARSNFFSNTIAHFIKSDPSKFWRYLKVKKRLRKSKLIIFSMTQLLLQRRLISTFNLFFSI